MKIRLTGTNDETKDFIEELKKNFEIISISEFYPNTRKVKESKEGRTYIELKITNGGNSYE